MNSTEAYAPLDETVYMCGYLEKQARDKRWQRRWFETNGSYLTYYKSRKMEKLLAALSLPEVGEIGLEENMDEGLGQPGTVFHVELHDRRYTLRASSAAEAAEWVAKLNQLRQAPTGNTPAPRKGITVAANEMRFSEATNRDSTMSSRSTIVSGAPSESANSSGDEAKKPTPAANAGWEKSSRCCCC